jgi:two-component system response regulator MprA
MANELILIVDDDPEMLTAIGRAIRKAGYRTAIASDGAAALAEIATNPPALVVSDVLMPPGINGFQLCRRVKGGETTKATPVILMSGKTDPVDHYWAEEVGARLLLRKPLDLTRLLAEITDGLTTAAS